MSPGTTIQTKGGIQLSAPKTPLTPDHALAALVAARNALAELTCTGAEFSGFPMQEHERLMRLMKGVLGFEGRKAQPGVIFAPSRKVYLETALNQLDSKTPPETPTDFNRDKRILWFEMGMAVRKTLKESGYDITSSLPSREIQDHPR